MADVAGNAALLGTDFTPSGAMDGKLGMDVSFGAAVVVTATPTISTPVAVDGGLIALDKAVTFTVQDLGGPLRRVLVVVAFPGRSDWEVIHDGSTFGPAYQGGGNSRVALSGYGYTYVVIRDGGWLEAPTFKVYAIDAVGNESRV